MSEATRTPLRGAGAQLSMDEVVGEGKVGEEEG